MTTRASREKSHAKARSSSRARTGAASIFHRSAIDLDAGTLLPAAGAPRGSLLAGADDIVGRAVGMDGDEAHLAPN